MATLQEVFNYARTLLNNGQEEKASLIFDDIVRQCPQFGAGWFYKAYCRHTSDPIAAADYYAKAILYDKNCAHHVANNLVIILNQNDSNPDVEQAVLQSCKTILSTYPDLWEIRYRAATITGNSGRYLEALSEYYKILYTPETQLAEDKDVFIDSLCKDIEICQAQIRARTLNSEVKKHFTPEESLFEYCYEMPVKPFFPLQKYYFDFGKYMGLSITEVVRSNPHYIDWCIQNVPSFCVNEVVCYDIMKKGFGTPDTLMLNNAKLQYLNSITHHFAMINQSDYPDIDLSDTDNLLDLLNR